MRKKGTTQRKAADNPTATEVGTTVGPNDNIFEVLDLPDADEWLAKAELARAIARVIQERNLTQSQAATLLGVVQSDISNLHRGRLAGYSMERFYRFLNALGQDVRIVVQPKPRSRREATIRTLVHRNRAA
ncbi:MAG: helix-turn-helix domain-containing protein [Gemmatimonadota bacterium]|nr:helix-turn-helix domain-containing protein [Gemmatimonadota bacterium]